MASGTNEASFWEMPIEDLVVQTLPATERLYSQGYAEEARAVLQARLAVEPAENAARAAQSSAVATRWVAGATIALFLATAALVVVELLRIVD